MRRFERASGDLPSDTLLIQTFSDPSLRIRMTIEVGTPGAVLLAEE
jgi:hypothetical protein